MATFIINSGVQCRTAIVVFVVDDAHVFFKDLLGNLCMSPLCSVMQRRLLRLVPERLAGIMRK